ncbi:MAG: class B sortase [Lachnospiraceae bacterium]|nr:class B sortase [Lachnospiraceae bacterium]
MKHTPDWKFILPFFAALAVFVFSAARLGMIFREYDRGKQQYQKLKSAVVVPKPELPGKEEPQFAIDFEKLKEINPDLAAWIYIDQLGISYPVVQGSDNDYYLDHTFYREENKCGSIFIEAGNHKDFSDLNTFVYGHNMKDKSMFARLNEYQEEKIFQENPEFYIYTPEGIKRYQIFSCYIAALDWDSFEIDFETEEAYAAWQDAVKKRSLYDTGVTPVCGQSTVTLMTCTPAGENYRFLVHGVLRDYIQ